MKYRSSKNCPLEFSVLGTGCWSFGGGEYWGNQDQSDTDRVVRASVDAGINYFDTAEAYNEGRSELSLGKAIKGIPRESILIGTKISPSNCYKNTLIRHCEDSLNRMNTGYIDLYMIHWPLNPWSIKHFTSDKQVIENPPAIEEAIEGLRILKQQGKIRYYGVSNFRHSYLKKFPSGEIAANQLPYNLLCRAIEYDVLPSCLENGIGIIGYMALFQGILAGLYPSLDEVPVWRRRTRHFNSKGNPECRHGENGEEEETTLALDHIRRISHDAGLSMSDIAIKWILENPAITCSLAGSRNIGQLEANVKAIEDPLDKEIKAGLDRITRPLMEKLGNHFDYYESAENDRTL